jgi:hypothetical protein
MVASVYTSLYIHKKKEHILQWFKTETVYLTFTPLYPHVHFAEFFLPSRECARIYKGIVFSLKTS